jgi:hypothetical protein
MADDHIKHLHRLTLNERVLLPEDGLLLGNGDLSVSVYQTADRMIWRFGKGDVWDRRLDLSDDPKPAHINEVARGIREEGWKCGPYGGPVEATKGTDNPQRMKELCKGCPPSYHERPYPCPKPVGELALYLPADLVGLKISQELVIEEALLKITCEWPSGVKLTVTSFIPTVANVLALKWKLENWNERTRTGFDQPVRFGLYRWADPTVQEFGVRFFGDFRHRSFYGFTGNDKVSPLDPPSVKQAGGLHYIEQAFSADPTFPNGFYCLMAPFMPRATIEPVDMRPINEARLHLMPDPGAQEGEFWIGVATTSDPAGPLETLKSFESLTFDGLSRSNASAAVEFWSKSRVRCSDPLLENLWYENLHARRSAFRAGTVPPGLFLPSTVRDYSHWHGDYHTNYNIQSPFLGDYTANHLELGDSYFNVMDFFLYMGKKLARDYYGCRGVFIQLTGYPILAADDPLGCLPMGRMAYMTGWASNPYWYRYRSTMDLDWLRQIGYPALRDCALFYTDFLKKGEDGLFHAFPSNQGEDGFTGEAQPYTDRSQIIRHARYTLKCAILAAEVLEIDPDLRAEWSQRIKYLAPEDGSLEQDRLIAQLEGSESLPPEFIIFDGKVPPPADAPSFFADLTSETWLWYAGKLPYIWMQEIRSKRFRPDRDYDQVRNHLVRWRRPNGVLCGMALSNYGHCGAFTETLSIFAPVQEMMLQSWDDIIRVFPAWPQSLEAEFDSLRAFGAFLVTAARSTQKVTRFEIFSEKGGPCRIQNPWPGTQITVQDDRGRTIPVSAEAGGIWSFQTTAGIKYFIA